MKTLKQSLFILGLVIVASFNMSFSSSAVTENAITESTVTTEIPGPGIYLGRWKFSTNGSGVSVKTCEKTPDPWNCTGWQWW